MRVVLRLGGYGAVRDRARWCGWCGSGYGAVLGGAGRCGVVRVVRGGAARWCGSGRDRARGAGRYGPCPAVVRVVRL
ncbi:hypothetical protein GCM10010358_27750 [Streptomyces minutiscleroticus]|uniref:Uncharacterized protein n=1 Tax=Streptomyces minutiscleroticus TaxID=68238 RepID=A0A918KPU4_9ACTN|nr:hypothetical protein GCM10010358_27750 [Streptomyces minutiscleroticus]